MRAFVSLLTLTFFLSGCFLTPVTTPAPQLVDEEVYSTPGLSSAEKNTVSREVRGDVAESRYPHVSIMDKFFPYRSTVEIGRCRSSFTLPPLSGRSITLPALKSYLSSSGVKAVIAPDLRDASVPPLNVSYPDGVPLCRLLGDVEKQMGIHASLSSSGVVVFSHFLHKTFSLPVIPGEHSTELYVNESDRMMGSTEGEGGGYIKSKTLVKRSLWKEIRANLDRLVQGKLGYYFINEGTGDIDVYASPSVMLKIDSYFKRLTAKLRKQIRVKVTVLEMTETGNKQVGVDWQWALERAIMKKPWEWGLKSGVARFSWGRSGRYAEEGAYSFGFQPVGGEDHLFYINLLKDFGRVKVIERTTISFMNGMSSLVTSGKYTEYLSKVEKTVNNDTNTEEFSVEKGVVFSGIRLFVSGFAVGDRVNLQVYYNMEDVLNMQEETFGGEEELKVVNPTVEKRKNVVTVQARDGRTVALVSAVKESGSARTTTPMIPLLGDLLGNRVRSDTNTYLVILLTPFIEDEEQGNSVI